MHTLVRKKYYRSAEIYFSCMKNTIFYNIFLSHFPQLQSAKEIYTFKRALKPLIDPCSCESLV